MERKGTIVLGMGLIGLGCVVLALSTILPALGWSWSIWRFWPLMIIAVGLLFVLPPFMAPYKRSLGGLFIPGMPILATGGILLFASIFDQWGVWASLWPTEILAVALGFLFAAIYMRALWLAVPTIIIGANGLLLQFCALTGLWGWWAMLWTIEPLSVGLALLLVGSRKGSAGLTRAGMIVSGVAAAGLVLMSLIFTRWWIFNTLGAAVLILVGLLLVLRGGLRRSASTMAAE